MIRDVVLNIKQSIVNRGTGYETLKPFKSENNVVLIDVEKPISELLHASVSKRVLVHNHSNGNELRIVMQIKTISLTIVEHQDSLRNRDKQQLGNGPLTVTLHNLFFFASHGLAN